MVATRQKVLGSNPFSDMDVCCGSNYTLNGGPSQFSPRVQNMSVVLTTNQPIITTRQVKELSIAEKLS